MNVYYYEPAAVGLVEFPPGYFKLAGENVHSVNDPALADCFVLPCGLSGVTNEQLLSLPHLAGNERRHVFFSLREEPDRVITTGIRIPAIIFRGDNNRGLLARGETTTITQPWGVPDLFWPNHREFKTDVVFQGWRGMTDLVDRSCTSVEREFARVNNHSLRRTLNCQIQINSEFFGYIETRAAEGQSEAVSEVESLRRTYLDGLAGARLVLAPQSHPEGVIRYRFYEAMSAGRVPVLIGDGSLPPLPDRIDYSKCSLQIPEADVDRTGEILADWLGHHEDAEIEEMGKYGHVMWSQWLDDDKWEYTWATLVAERLEAAGWVMLVNGTNKEES